MHRLADLVYISLRWGEVSSLYYAQGLDEVGTSVAGSYLAYPVFRSLRNAGNRRAGTGRAFDYVCLLQDKLLFDRYFRAGDISVIPVLGQIFPSLRCEYAGRHYETISSLAARLEEGTELFCKPRTGIKGAHVFKLGIRQGTLLINGEPVDESDIGVFVREAYVCQKRIEQHPDLARFHEDSLNTLRVITWRVGNHIEVFGCYLRMGASGAITDNDTQARAVVRVDPVTGDLNTHGYATFGDSVYETAHHPTTKVAFQGASIPRYQECIETARAAHKWLPGVQSVGWDLVPSLDGVELLEGNDDWGAIMAMWVLPDFVESFLEWRQRAMRDSVGSDL